MILIGYRHGLRASELCDLQWSQVELATGRLHVRRAKNGSPSVHPMKRPRPLPVASGLEKRIRDALTTPGRPGMRKIAARFGVYPGTVQRISRPFVAPSVGRPG
jgi:integrase